VIGILAVSLDITEQKKQAAALKIYKMFFLFPQIIYHGIS